MLTWPRWQHNETVHQIGSSPVLSMSSGMVMLTNGAGAAISLCGALITVVSGTVVDLTGSRNLHSGGSTNMSAGGNINASAATIKLNG